MHCPATPPGPKITTEVIGGGTQLDELTRLRYYATDEQRVIAKRDNPRMKLPPRQKPLAHRDWRLPKGPF